MKLQTHLISRIATAGLLCLIIASGLLLYRSDRQARTDAQTTLDNAGHELELQLLKWGATLRLDNPFPDFFIWQHQPLGKGDCLAFVTEAGVSRRYCNGEEPLAAVVPSAFAALYRAFFNPDKPLSKPIVYHKRQYGVLTISPSATRQLGEAWAETSSLTGFAALLVGAVCMLVFGSVSRALAPSRVIVAGLEDMERGYLGHRLPHFEWAEWRMIANAINHLAATQQQLLAERQMLAVRLMSLQEDERRDLAREIHDEFGQCLAGVGALTLLIEQGVRERCPALVVEARQIREISQRMLDHMRGLLNRLRPAELDELGLEPSLRSLVSDWNAHHRGFARCRLTVDGDCSAIPELHNVALYRAVQESLTNVTRHAKASEATVALKVSAGDVWLTVWDDGLATAVPERFGVGLLGMRERIGALRGRLELRTAHPHGLIVDIRLPLVFDRDLRN